MLRMAAAAFIHCRVPTATKTAFGVMARHQGMTDSALLRRMIDLSLQSAGVVSSTDVVSQSCPAVGADVPIDGSATGRRPAAIAGEGGRTRYGAGHLRFGADAGAPAITGPVAEGGLLALKRTVAELGAIGRNLNQIARAANQGERVDGPGPHEVQLMLRVCGGLRDHVKALLLANLRSWQ